MTTRTRNRSVFGPTGVALFNGSVTSRKAPVTIYQVTTDVVGNYGKENPFDSYSGSITSPGLVSGKSGFTEFRNYPVTFASNGYSPPLPPLPGESFGDVSKAIAGSHPGSPPVSIPNFLFELRDVPRMVSHAISKAQALEKAAGDATGKSHFAAVARYMNDPKKPAEDWLNYHFGWAPLVGDLFALSNISKYLEQRLKWVNSPRASRITRKRELGSFSSTSTIQGGAYDANTGTTANFVEYNKSRRWVVSHWKQDQVAASALLENHFTKALVGAGFDAPISSVWNAIPFTWLTDWFVDIGSLIEIRENRSGIHFLDASMMTLRERTLTVHPLPKSGFKFTGMVCQAEHKVRVPVAPSAPSVGGTNILQPQHLATLASLKVTRGARVAF